MPIHLNDLKAAYDKLSEPQEALEKRGGIMDQLSGKYPTMNLESGQQAVKAMQEGLAAQALVHIKAMTGLQEGLAAQTQADMKTLQAGIGNIDLGLGPAINTFLANLEESERRKREALAYYRPQAYALITAEHLEHAILNIDWAEFVVAQRPNLTEQEAAAGDPIPFLRHEHSYRRCPNRRLNSASSRSLCLIIASLS